LAALRDYLRLDGNRDEATCFRRVARAIPRQRHRLRRLSIAEVALARLRKRLRVLSAIFADSVACFMDDSIGYTYPN
jgi:hypothetical protein